MNTITNNINNYNERFANIKRMLNNTEEIGKSTLVELSNQGEHLKNINSKSNNLYEQLKITKSKLHKIVSRMSITNLLFNNEINILNTSKDDISLLKINNSDFIDISTNILDNSIANNCNIDDISIKLNKLKSIANDMSNEIKEQNIYINSLSTNIDKLNNISDKNNNIILII